MAAGIQDTVPEEIDNTMQKIDPESGDIHMPVMEGRCIREQTSRFTRARREVARRGAEGSPFLFFKRNNEEQGW